MLRVKDGWFIFICIECSRKKIFDRDLKEEIANSYRLSDGDSNKFSWSWKKKVFAVWKYEGSLPEKEGFYSALNMKEYLIWSRTCKKCLQNFEWISWFVDIKKNHYY